MANLTIKTQKPKEESNTATNKTYTESTAVVTARDNANKYNTYTEGTSVTDARNKLNTYETNNNPGTWTGGTYGQAVKDAYNEWNNRKAFSYDLNGDALYQQYKDKFINQGRLAMADTIGQASAMTGGYGSSYATTAGSQAYQSHLQNLNDIVPQLYEMAYNRYTQEGNDLKDKYSMLNNMYATEYGEHRDKVGDYNTTLARLTEMYNNERTFDRGVYDADRTYANTVYDNERNYDFGVYQQAVNEEIQRANLSIAQDQLKLQQDAANNSGGGGEKIQGLSVEESMQVYDTIQELRGMKGKTQNEIYEAIDEYIDTLAIFDSEKAHLWQRYLPKSYLYPGNSGNTTFTTGVGANKNTTLKN